MIDEFKKFIMRGNVLDLAVGIVIGGAFGTIVGSFVNDILMPPVGLLMGRVDFANLFINLTPEKYSGAVLAEARKAGAAAIAYGTFINTVINFLIVAFVIFLIVKAANRAKDPQPVAAVTTKDCPFCLKEVPLKATRCAFCTSAFIG